MSHCPLLLIGEPFLERRLEEVDNATSGVSERWNAAIRSAPMIALDQGKLALWKESLKRCKREAEGEIATELLLEPLWQVWAPMFERELMTDLQPLPMAEKLK